MQRSKSEIIKDCNILLKAYKEKKLGYMKMPEDEHPEFSPADLELRLLYFTLPMSLNYQRNSYTLWESALKTYLDKETSAVFDISFCTNATDDILRNKLTKYKLALQPNKHISTWKTIAKTIHTYFGSMVNLLQTADFDFLKLQQIVQIQHKKGFPYLSGPKIFHYWCFILQEYGGVSLKNAEYIEIAPDTHITKCSVKLGLVSESEAKNLSKEQISKAWRNLLQETTILPIQMHPPLWFWSRNNFEFKLNLT